MAKCCNCGIEISADDRTKLCDGCKKFILPFVKFMDVSTSSAVRRLVTNERNLRNAGVTDSGMDYLLRICELHDKKKAREKQAREDAKRQQALEEQAAFEESAAREEERTAYLEAELPMEAPLNLCRKSYGGFLAAAAAVLIIVGITLIAVCVMRAVMVQEFDVIPLACGIGSLFSAYTAYVCRKIIRDLEEVKKYFR